MDINIKLEVILPPALAQLLEGVVAEMGKDRPTPAAQTAGAKTAARTPKQASAGGASDTSAKGTGSATAEADEETEVELTYDSDIKPLILKMAKELGEDRTSAALGAFKDAAGKKVVGGKGLQAKDWATFKRMGDKLLEDGPVDGDEGLAY